MIEIKGQIFMGAGEHSLARVGYLQQRLSEAFVILGGIQQPPSVTSDYPTAVYEEEVSSGEKELEHIAREIFLALTGRKVV